MPLRLALHVSEIRESGKVYLKNRYLVNRTNRSLGQQLGVQKIRRDIKRTIAEAARKSVDLGYEPPTIQVSFTLLDRR